MFQVWIWLSVHHQCSFSPLWSVQLASGHNFHCARIEASDLQVNIFSPDNSISWFKLNTKARPWLDYSHLIIILIIKTLTWTKFWVKIRKLWWLWLDMWKRPFRIVPFFGKTWVFVTFLLNFSNLVSLIFLELPINLLHIYCT